MQDQGRVNVIVTGKEKNAVAIDHGVVTENTESAAENVRVGVADTMMRGKERGATEENVETAIGIERGRGNIGVAIEEMEL